jgi:hypothetical protein
VTLNSSWRAPFRCAGPAGQSVDRPPSPPSAVSGYQGRMTGRVMDQSKGETDIAIRRGRSRDGALLGRKIARAVCGLLKSVLSCAQRNATVCDDIKNHSIIEFFDEIADLATAR